VTRQPVHQGADSAHNAVLLHTDDGKQLILQRLSGNPFSDPESDKLVGRRMTVDRYRLNNIFRHVTVNTE
jgi:hypothetical protein